MKDKDCPKYEDCIDIIDKEIAKKRNKWTLTSIAHLDYDDVSQIIRLHIWKKWHLYDCEKSLAPWLSVIISHQISNLIRNNYSNYTKPCTKCAAAEGSDGCKIYGEQCAKCPLFADWTKRKQSAQHIKMAVPIDNHINEIHEISDTQNDLTDSIIAVHEKMRQVLKPIEYKVYEGLFILNEEESEVAKKVGYVSNEKGRQPGYKQIKNIRKTIIEKVKKYLKNEDINLN